MLRLTGAEAPERPRRHDAMTGRGKAIVAALAITQTVGYGCLWYSFPVFLAPLAHDLRASPTTVTGAFTVAILSAAALAVPVGRRLDHHGSRGLMTTGSMAGAGLLVALSQVRTVPQLYLVWAGIGAVGAMVFYEAAFATVIAWTPPPHRAGALLVVTVVAGFASSIFLPLTGHLVATWGWRSAALALAAILGAVTVPLHALVLRRAPQLEPAFSHGDAASAPGRGAAEQRRATVEAAARQGRYWLLGAALTAQAFALSAMTVHLIGFLVSAGHSAATAATTAGALGALSVTGRLAVTGLTRRLSLTRVVATVFAVQAVAAVSLPYVAGPLWGAVVGVMGFGIGFGVATIARPALLTHYFGTVGYASLSARLAVPVTLATAAAPLVTAQLQHVTGSYVPVMVLVGSCNASASLAVLLVGRWPMRSGLVRDGAHPSAGTDSSARSVRTRRSMSSRMGRTASTSWPAGSSRTHSS